LWREYEGGITDWLTQRERARVVPANVAAPSAPRAAASPPATKTKLSYKEQRELAALPARIEALEAEKREIEAQLADGSIYVRDRTRAAALHARTAQIEEALTAALERWAALDAR
jgi:ATP-binding cassette subfamily F protein uup